MFEDYEQEEKTKEFEIKQSKIELKMKSDFIRHIQLSRFKTVEEAESVSWENLRKEPMTSYWIRLMDDVWTISDRKNLDSGLLKIAGVEELMLSSQFHYNRGAYGSRRKVVPDMVINYMTGSPLISTAVEYDGSFWHKDTEGKDIRKTIWLLSNNYLVVRFRETPLNNIPIDKHSFKDNLLQISFDPDNDSFEDHIDDVLNFYC